jgi:hypothetical protein
MSYLSKKQLIETNIPLCLQHRILLIHLTRAEALRSENILPSGEVGMVNVEAIQITNYKSRIINQPQVLTPKDWQDIHLMQ